MTPGDYFLAESIPKPKPIERKVFASLRRYQVLKMGKKVALEWYQVLPLRN